MSVICSVHGTHLFFGESRSVGLRITDDSTLEQKRNVLILSQSSRGNNIIEHITFLKRLDHFKEKGNTFDARIHYIFVQNMPDFRVYHPLSPSFTISKFIKHVLL